MLLLRERDPLRLFNKLDSPITIALKAAGSLASRLTAGRDVEVAERMRAIILLGPLETLRRCCSVDSARWSVLGVLLMPTRLVDSPGF